MVQKQTGQDKKVFTPVIVFYKELLPFCNNNHMSCLAFNQLVYWWDKVKRPFYKFLLPPSSEHLAYKEGDSIGEELGLLNGNTLRKTLSPLVTTWKTKKLCMAAVDKFKGKPFYSYVDKQTNCTFYVGNNRAIDDIILQCFFRNGKLILPLNSDDEHVSRGGLEKRALEMNDRMPGLAKTELDLIVSAPSKIEHPTLKNCGYQGGSDLKNCGSLIQEITDTYNTKNLYQLTKRKKCVSGLIDDHLDECSGLANEKREVIPIPLNEKKVNSTLFLGEFSKKIENSDFGYKQPVSAILEKVPEVQIIQGVQFLGHSMKNSSQMEQEQQGVHQSGGNRPKSPTQLMYEKGEKVNIAFSKAWTAYRKKGSAAESCKEWLKLTDEEREAAANSISQYLRYATRGDEKNRQFVLDFERYLKRRKWESDLSITGTQMQGNTYFRPQQTRTQFD